MTVIDLPKSAYREVDPDVPPDGLSIEELEDWRIGRAADRLGRLPCYLINPYTMRVYWIEGERLQ